ncbi:MAG TPA: hypothetical protein PKJ42_03870, partial [Candidatus Goldiibacteriota bacterium]|nr:hypothetical protein [Candidatus Goldiibacteriota bacterium]
MVTNYTLNGWEDGQHINNIFGASAAAVIVGQNFGQMEDWFRELMCLWDSQGTGGDGYLTSTPRYFHEFFRTLGLVMFTGNYNDPCNWVPQANMKIYKAVDKTYAFTGDTLTYHLNYRNYGSVDATGVYITDTLPSDLEFISSTPAPSSSSGNTYRWGPFNVTGLHNQNVGATVGGITLVARIKDTAPNGRICNTADISPANGTGWTTSDEPNDISTVMRRNCVDIISAALVITKTANAYAANPGDTITYTIQYENSSKAGWLDGGRYGVTFNIGPDGSIPGTSTMDALYTVYAMHQAAEPMIDWANYRISFFVNSDTHGAGWKFFPQNYQGIEGGMFFESQDLVPDCDAQGCWNQRLIVRFGNQANPSYTLPSFHLHKFFGLNYMVHFPDPVNGNAGKDDRPFWAQIRVGNANSTAQDWTDDWSQLSVLGGQNMRTPPISEDYTDGDPTTPGIPVTKMNKDACETEPTNVTNILVEEWDGYTWRRVFGNGPQPGRQIQNIHIIDSLPAELNFGGFVTTTPVGTYNAGTRTMDWNVGNMLVNESGYVSYWATVAGSCPMGDKTVINNAWIYGDNESPVADSWTVSVTCNYVPPPPPPPSSLTKTASAASVAQGSNITYTINYTNLIGCVVDSSKDSTVFANNADWTAAPSYYTFSGGNIITPSNTNTLMTYDFSGGVNGTIYATVAFADSQDFGMKFRNNGFLYLNKSWSESAALYNGATIMDSYAATGGGKIPAVADIKIVMNGTTVSVFVKDHSITAWSPTPLLASGSMPAASGMAGFVHGSVAGGPTGKGTSGNHTISYFRTELDTAYNILVRDPVPAGMAFVSASNSGALNTGEVRWPLIPSRSRALMNSSA